MQLKQDNSLAKNTKNYPLFRCRCITSRKSHFEDGCKITKSEVTFLRVSFVPPSWAPYKISKVEYLEANIEPEEVAVSVSVRASGGSDAALLKEQNVNIDDPSFQIIVTISRLLVHLLSLIRLFLSYSSISFCRMDYSSHPGMCADWMVTASQ